MRLNARPAAERRATQDGPAAERRATQDGPAAERRATPRPGFSLIEVMIGVMVLALGLLGLGAVIPVVIREQRIAGDATQGRACLGEVRAYLQNRPELNPSALPTWDAANSEAGPAGRVVWDVLIQEESWSGPWAGTGAGDEGLWTWGEPTLTDPLAAQGSSGVQTGDMVWPETLSTATPGQVWAIRMADRLWPSESSQSVESLPNGLDPYRPIFVWDFVARRAEFGDMYARAAIAAGAAYPAESVGRPDVIQVAVFVRRIDLNIRLPRVADAKLRDVLLARSRVDQGQGTNIVNPSDERLPVTEDGNGRPTNNGDPTQRGYSTPVTIGASLNDPLVRNRIRMDPAASNAVYWQLARQPGQKVVDNLGNVYTVRANDADDPAYVPLQNELIVDPPVPFSVADPGSDTPSELRQIVFTGQIPVAVEVITIKRPVYGN